MTGCKGRPAAANPKAGSDQVYASIEGAFTAGDLVAAEKLARSALNDLNDQDTSVVPLKVELAKIKLYQGRGQDVVAILDDPHLQLTDNELAIKRNLLLAVARTRLGDARLADQSLAEAWRIQDGCQNALCAETLGVAGMMALDRGRLDEAETLLTKARDTAQKRGDRFLEMQMRMNLGVLEMQREHYEAAIASLSQASALAENIGAKLALEKITGNMGWIYFQLGDFPRALKASESAAAQSSVIGATLDQVQWLDNSGVIEAKAGNTGDASSLLNTSLNLAESLGNNDKVFSAHVRLAALLLNKDLAGAESHIASATSIAKQRNVDAEMLEPALLEAMLELKKGQSQAAAARLRSLVSGSAQSPAVRWEAENALAALHDKEGRSRESERWYRRAIDTFHTQRLTLQSVELELPFLENGSDLYMGYMEHLIRAGRTGDALRLLDASRAETLAEGLGTASPPTGGAADPRTVAGRLRATILVYCLRPERSYLWAISGKQQQFYTLPGSGDILPLVARHNEAILASKDLLVQKGSTGRALYDALLAPAAGLLPKDGGRVVLVADSALSRLNFETLIPPGISPHYWLEDASVTNARSLRLLAANVDRISATKKAKREMLLIGDPVYAKGEYASLPYAGVEMRGIAGHFGPDEVTVAARQEASPEAYAASKPGRFRFIHFVAHATASELNPLDSAVILSSKATEGAAAANKLYASEILKQPLSAELVTLSSCYSSGTRNYTGEGVVGLAWAFLRAGAHAVIGALWEVSDASTPKLMDTMYTRLLADAPPDAALREAKLEMLRGGGVYRKPIYWAPFQLYAGR